MPNPGEIPSRRSNLEAHKARGPARKVRALCDCGCRLARFMDNARVSGGGIVFNEVIYCPECDDFFDRKIALDSEEHTITDDPRPANRQGKPPAFKNIRRIRERHRREQ